jgi:molybdopterin-guanine dinucleotide biosynthesis protein A/ketosteroid isomerase-like protein
VDEVLGAILAGGRATRLGRPKATAELGGRPLLERPLQVLEAAGIETVIVAKEDTALPPGAAPVWREPDEPVHPLLGIVTALEQSGGRAVLACACDLPFASPALAASIAETGAPLVVPSAGGRLHPLFARYTAALLPALRGALEQSAPLQATVAALEPLILDEQALSAFGDPARLLFNVNTQADLELAETMLDEDIESLRRGFESFSRGDLDEMLAFSAPDVVVHDAPELPGGGVHRGREAVRRGLEDFRATFDDLEVEPEEFMRVDDRILVVFRAVGRGGESGIPLDIQLANVFTMKDGVVVEWHSYTSRAQAMEALGLEDEG